MSTPADIAIYGGAAGSGKSFAMLLEPLRHISNPNFGAVVFRRTSVQVRNEGGLWDETKLIYPDAGGKSHDYDLWWKFPSGASISFAHLEHEKNALDWQGSQICLIEFDELTHFTSSQFWYLLSRNRSNCGVRPYVRASCNPDCDSWVATFIEWWINPDTGYPIAERSGVLRWFIRLGEKIIWADKPEELASYVNPMTNEPIPPKSVTFIPASLADNQILAESDPGYMANLMALPLVERERLLYGNWKVRWQGEQFFTIGNLLDGGRPVEVPKHCDAVFAVLDTASKTGSEHDGTAVVYCARSRWFGHPLVILDWEIHQIGGNLLEDWLPQVFSRGEYLAGLSGSRRGFVGTWIEDKQSGTILLQQAKRRGMKVHPISTKLTAVGKDERAFSISGYVSNGKVKISDLAWNKTVLFKGSTRNHFLSQLEGFSIAAKDAKNRADDLLDAFCYSVSLALGNSAGF